MGLQQLLKKYPYPSVRPDMPTNTHGWMLEGNKQKLKENINSDTKVIVELGSWMGLSSRWLLDNAPNVHLVCVDHWEGSTEHKSSPEQLAVLPKLYDQFITNCWDYRGRLTPMRIRTVPGLVELYMLGVEPDLIYVDASHDYNSVIDDLTLCLNLFPYATVIGDDYLTFPEVARAANDMRDQCRDYNFEGFENVYVFVPRG